MGTGESMYFLPSLFYSERSQPCESYLVGTQHSCGKWGVVFITVRYGFQFLKNFVHFSPCQLEFCVWHVIKINTSIVYGRQLFCSVPMSLQTLASAKKVRKFPSCLLGSSASSGCLSIVHSNINSGHICHLFSDFVLQPLVKSGREISKHLIV